MKVFLMPFITLIIDIIGVAKFFIIFEMILRIMIFFNILQSRQSVIRSICTSLSQITCYLLDPIRRIIPIINGIDISPIVVILALSFVQNLFRSILIIL